MKTAEKWQRELIAKRPPECEWTIYGVEIKQIQSDAHAQGMRDAAEIAHRSECENCSKIADPESLWPSEAILAAIPKE